MEVHIRRFVIGHTIPEREVPTLSAYLNELDQILPTWCHEVHVDLEHIADDSAAEVTSRYDYRRAWIKLGSKFFTEQDRQWKVLLHEVLHIVHEPLWNTVVDLRSKLVELEPNNKELMLEITRHAREQVVCDMTYMIQRLLDSIDSDDQAPRE